MEAIDDRHPNSANRSMLAAVATVVAGLLLLVQVVLFVFFPWHRERVYSFMGSYQVWVLHPIVVWIPFWIGILAVTWWSACRKYAPKRQLRWLLLFLLLSAGMASWGLVREAPASWSETRGLPEFPGTPEF